ncbi:thioredoxin [Clostridium argentinense CDC 2741]|uniref:Thioredoxin n=1 Tax=Clostridium argentinense CDC 2741 TaxID=1418104 RepID=A0A0C1R3V3_9CLOT|nr:thioredoxin [Clostridium argentinense]HAG44676.1 thioredoxin [Clostridium sp.]ARC83739.1 thiol reductase thioredoxin [Clostridium argentinense]KIE45156.1 thioredoxin [Clostridium argentinense CDC 2741]NFF39641.1 thioredoxin [Clostridium argentinense]NFP49642.1 thioredoxin [Clostridium argentinense]
MLELREDNFKLELANTDKPVVVDFWASWCGPCEMLRPVIEELSQEMPEAIFAKVNVEDNSALAREHRVMSIPTIKIFKNGAVVETSVGFKQKEELRAIVEKHV